MRLASLVPEGADADFQTLLRVEWENDSTGKLFDDPPMSRMSEYSGTSGFSGISGASRIPSKSALSEGSQLRWKTGSLRRRRDKAEQARDQVRLCKERTKGLAREANGVRSEAMTKR